MNEINNTEHNDTYENEIKKGDGKYVFIPEGYMSVLIPIDNQTNQTISSLNSKINPSIPNNTSNNQINSLESNVKQENTNNSINLENDKSKNIKNKEKYKEIEKKKKIPRPKNSFIFYLQDKTPSFLKINPNINRREVSREVGKMWRNETEEVKKYYAEKARIELENHKLKYPNYKFSPERTKKNKKTNNETKKTKDINKQQSLDDLSIIQNMKSKSTRQTRQRSISSSVFQSKKLKEIYNENNMEYEEEQDDHDFKIENDHDLYQTLINSVPLNNNNNNNNFSNSIIQSTTNPQSFDLNSAMTNEDDNNSFSSLDNNSSNICYDYDSNSLISADFSSSYFDELSLSSYNTNISETINPSMQLNLQGSSNNMNELLDVTNNNIDLNITDPLTINQSSLFALENTINPTTDNTLFMNDPLLTLPNQAPINELISDQCIDKLPNNDGSNNNNNSLLSLDIQTLPQMVHQQNDITINDNSVHSPVFDEIFGSVLNTNVINNNIIIPSEIMNMNSTTETLNNLPNTIFTNDISIIPTNNSTDIIPNNDTTTNTSNKNKRLSQIQQKNNLKIITSAEDLNELANSDILNLQNTSSHPTTTDNSTTNTNITNTNSTNYSFNDDTNTNESNISTPSYLLSKMSLLENFNDLSLNSSNKYKSSIHNPNHSHSYNNKRRNLNNINNQTQCNSASIVINSKPSNNLPLNYPLSAGLWNPSHQEHGLFDYINANGLELSSASTSIPSSTNSGPASANAILNNNINNPFEYDIGLGLEKSKSSSHDNLDILSSSNNSIHSTNRTSSSIKKKTKPISMKLSSQKRSVSLSKLNSSSNSLLSTSESYHSSSSSSLSLKLKHEDSKKLTMDPAEVVLHPPSTIDFQI